MLIFLFTNELFVLINVNKRHEMSENDDNSVHRLEASAPATGGLVLKKKDFDSSFKVPKPSLLGLDRLAAQKRKEREDQKRLISFKESEYDDDVTSTPDHGAMKTPDHDSVHRLSRQYRELKDETPSHGGGVSDKARDRLAERIEKDRRGVYVSSKDEKRRRHKDDYYERNYDRKERDRHRDNRDRDSERHREKDRDYDRRRDKSDRSRDSGFSTRDRRKPSDSERSLNTPRFRDEPKTPQTPYTAATASSSWDDDDDRSTSKRSAWDFPTPKDGGKRSEWSTRSNISSISPLRKGKMEDDTPRPTPAHKYNAWANDRKRSGATPHTSKLKTFIKFVQLEIDFFIKFLFSLRGF